jgi:hypothetical protein
VPRQSHQRIECRERSTDRADDRGNGNDRREPAVSGQLAGFGDQLSGFSRELDRLVGELACFGLLTLDTRDDLVKREAFRRRVANPRNPCVMS